MPLFTAADRRRAEGISELVYCNPFDARRIELERAVLGPAFDETAAAWNLHPDWGMRRGNVEVLADVAEDLARRARQRIVDGLKPSPVEAERYADLVLFGLYYRHRPELDLTVVADEPVDPEALRRVWSHFAESGRHYLGCLEPGPDEGELALLFAFCIQFCRAFHRVFDCIIGASPAAIQLRVQAWQSIFTHDMRRYRRCHHERMGDYTTLITGPSGTGKEIVARAIGKSRFVPFDPRRGRLVGEAGESFYTLNLSALSSQLIEGELFGHTRGAFTGAVGDRKGWLEVCPSTGSVFLDEMGEVDQSIQIKLLRVLENRTFHRVGDAVERRFAGKLIAATNRDLAEEMHAGRFRPDLYYRLCADTIRTPSLRERIADDDGERRLLLEFLARRAVGDRAEELVVEAERWIDQRLPPEYPWPGNVRELDQCLRNVLIRREYHPAVRVERRATDDGFDRLAAAMRSESLSADEVMRRYCTLVYRREGSYEAAARRLQLDRRTVRARVDRDGPGELQEG